MNHQPAFLPAVALVGPYPPPAGGMSVLVQALDDRLRSRGVPVESVPTQAGSRKSRYALTGDDFSRMARILARLYRRRGNFGVVNVHVNSGLSFLALALPLAGFCKALGKALVVTYHGGGAQAFFDGPAGHTLPLLKAMATVTVQSGYLEQVFAGLGVKTTVIPNFVTLPLLPRDPQPGRILVNRNFHPIYRVDTVIDALALLTKSHPHARLAVAGGGPLRGELESRARDRGIGDRVEFLGSLGREDMARELSKAQVFVNPSTVDNTPNSVIEALCMGLPIVTTGVGGIPFLVKDGVSALVTPPADPKAIAAAIVRILDDENLASRLSQAARAQAGCYDPGVITDQWIRLFANLTPPAKSL